LLLYFAAVSFLSGVRFKPHTTAISGARNTYCPILVPSGFFFCFFFALILFWLFHLKESAPLYHNQSSITFNSDGRPLAATIYMRHLVSGERKGTLCWDFHQGQAKPGSMDLMESGGFILVRFRTSSWDISHGIRLVDECGFHALERSEPRFHEL
jgi:hypothetical protein